MSQQAAIEILMIDDDREDAFLMRRALSKSAQNIGFHHLDDSAQFIIDLKQEATAIGCNPDVILLDLNMPRVNGFEVLKAIKSSTEFNSAKVVMLTTSESEDDKKKALQLGASEFVSKPHTSMGLEQFVKSLMRNF